MNRIIKSVFPACVLAPGLLTAQVIATLFVYFSNTGIYETLTAVTSAGYLAVPNPRVLAGIREFTPAFHGGLFFTFTLGAGISAITMGSVWIWDRLFNRSKRLSLLFLLPWIGSIVCTNWKDFSPATTGFFLLVPAVVLPAAVRWRTAQGGNGTRLAGVVFWAPFILLLVLWLGKVDNDMMLSFRDNMLLSNPLGTKINDYYYTYSLYPAEAIKSLDQKLIRTCNLDAVGNRPVKNTLKNVLLSNDYLDVGSHTTADLKIRLNNNALIFENRGTTVSIMTLDDFLSNPAAALKDISARSDRFGFFRHATFLSLLVGLPAAAYILLQAIFTAVSSCFLSPGNSRLAASIICFGVGAALLWPALIEKERTIPQKELGVTLESENWRDRVAAMKVLLKNSMEVGDFKLEKRITKSPHIPERYWLVRVLGISRKPETYSMLLGFLDDPYPNVVCMAYRSLGQRQNRTAVGEILKRIRTSDHWYEQWYAYKALKTLGWKQTGSS